MNLGLLSASSFSSFLRFTFTALTVMFSAAVGSVFSNKAQTTVHYLLSIKQHTNTDRDHGSITGKSGYSIRGGARFISMKAAEWRKIPKPFDFPGIKSSA